MAFIELTEDEIALLDVSEREHYNRELKLYRERVAFVERLVQIENANFQYQKPEFKPIKPVRRVDIPKYAEADKVGVSLPDNIAQVKEVTNIGKMNSLLHQQVMNGIPQNVKIANIPNVKVSLPDENIGYSGISDFKISNVEGAKQKVDAPEFDVKPMEKSSITNFPEAVKVIAPQAAFEFERGAVNVETVKTELPQISKFTGIDAVKIENIPEIQLNSALETEFEFSYDNEKAIQDIENMVGDVIEAPETTFEFTQDNEDAILDVQNMVANAKKEAPEVSFSFAQDNEKAMQDIQDVVAAAKKELPEVSFEMEPVSVSEISKPEIQSIDTSEISERIEMLKSKPTEPISLNTVKPSLPDIADYQKPDIKLELPQTNKVVSPDPSDFSVPAIEKVSHVIMPGLDLPDYKVNDFVYSGVGELPEISVNSPCCTVDEVDGVMQRILKSMQGA